MQEQPKSVKSSAAQIEALDRIMRIVRRNPITGPALEFAADAFKDNPTRPTRVTFANGVNGPRT